MPPRLNFDVGRHQVLEVAVDNGNPEIVRAAIFEIIENQLNDNDPPETKETLNRLLAEGHSHEEAMKLIACVVVSEIWEIMQQGQEFNQALYIKALSTLPKLPWE